MCQGCDALQCCLNPKQNDMPLWLWRLISVTHSLLASLLISAMSADGVKLCARVIYPDVHFTHSSIFEPFQGELNIEQLCSLLSTPGSLQVPSKMCMYNKLSMCKDSLPAPNAACHLPASFSWNPSWSIRQSSAFSLIYKPAIISTLRTTALEEKCRESWKKDEGEQ